MRVIYKENCVEKQNHIKETGLMPSYVVYAIKIDVELSVQIIKDHANPCLFAEFVPLKLFDLVDNRISKYFCCGRMFSGYGNNDETETVPLFSFSDFARDIFFWNNVFESRECENIFLKYKKLMDFEFYNPNLLNKKSQSLEILENNWAMCPVCVDGFEVKTTDEMIVCSQCDTIYVNPLQKASIVK
jgi:hypothetical protein